MPDGLGEESDWFNTVWDECLRGGVILSEYSKFLAQDAYIAWEAGAYIAAILVAQAAIETHMRFETESKRGISFFNLVEQANISDGLRKRIHNLRVARNRWVHVPDPNDDQDLQKDESAQHEKLAADSKEAIITMIKALCAWQWV